ncbi:IgGFc-binding protein [Toxotes jaculatrix]|uniref:IgGFc-binding protein n=1 Tax=Toxotes jaculatrix TaxID=941984 RepID=UPI001B3A96F8|nr:IgGFc-binding protein [Toxotes jaculatrix]XP_040899398.1 IgGFc-binding protein [Toxotes jaculatrix]
MCPGLLLFLLLAALNSESTAKLPEDSTGTKFIAAFPENIAYYYPVQPENKIQITALYDNTNVTIQMHTFNPTTETMRAGQSKDFVLHSRMELRKSQISNKTLVITSNHNIIVRAISLKHNSVQSALLIPTDKLGKEYLIPPTPRIPGTTDQVTLDVTERSPFKLIIISAEQGTTVTIEGAKTENVQLESHQLTQIWINESDKLRAIKADQPVAVLFAHSCAIRSECTCGLLYTMLLPAKEEKSKFFIPPVLVRDVYAETFLLLSEKESTEIMAFNSTVPLVKTANSAILYRPGLLLTLIPETDFASCFFVSPVFTVETSAVIIVHKNFTDGVRIGNSPPMNPDWQELKDTMYVSTEIKLEQNKNFIWHTSSKMAVYIIEKNGSALFGNPAPIISTSPDFRGCAVTPEVVKIGEVAQGWRESLQYCKNMSLDLVSISDAQLGAQIYEKITQVKNNGVEEVWIGMRRSSLTGNWYWLNNSPVSETNWEGGEPSKDNGQCAIMSLKTGKNFGWSDEDCCKAAHPVCYKNVSIFSLCCENPTG